MIPARCDDEASATPQADADHAMPSWYRAACALTFLAALLWSWLDPWGFALHP